MNFTESDDLAELLASWAVKHNCTRDCTNDLLKIIREKGHNLPKDSRSLLNTARIEQWSIKKSVGKVIYI